MGRDEKRIRARPARLPAFMKQAQNKTSRICKNGTKMDQNKTSAKIFMIF